MRGAVRFAPSPTGRLHVGNVRTALLNWLAARKSRRRFILRIDDTDRTRSREKHVEAIREDLAWLGLDWDETFRQSARLARYDAAADALRKSGRLYPCYETQEELALKRRTARRRGGAPIYDRAALSLSAKERAALEAGGRTPHWRFRLSAGEIRWQDAIRGECNIDLDSLSDPVLVRGDAQYLYMLCSVVDDAETGVDLVIRGEDHTANAAQQIDLAHALAESGFCDVSTPPPAFAHHAMLIGAGGEALSKRLGSLAVADFRARGFEPLALLALLARLGSSMPVQPVDTMDALLATFHLGHFSRAPARFDEAELTRLNARMLHAMPFEAVEARMKPLGLAEPRARALWEAVHRNITTFAQIREWAGMLDGGGGPRSDSTPEEIPAEDQEFLHRAMALLPPSPRDECSWAEWVSRIRAETGRKGTALYRPLRRFLTGREDGPEMARLLPLFSEKALARKKAASAPGNNARATGAPRTP